MGGRAGHLRQDNTGFPSRAALTRRLEAARACRISLAMGPNPPVRNSGGVEVMSYNENESRKKRYAEDPAYREKKLAASSDFYHANKAKILEGIRGRRKEDPEYREKDIVRQRKQTLKACGGTLADYDRMVAQLDGKCRICKQKPDKPLFIDHCHKRRKLRALLCQHCNSMLGFSRDNPDHLEEGAKVLREFISLHGSSPEVTRSRPRNKRGRPSKLRPQPAADHRNGPAVAVVGGVRDELVIERQPPGEERQAVVHLDDLLRARIGQLAVADENAETAGIEKGLMLSGDSVDDAGQSERVVRPTPALAVERQAGELSEPIAIVASQPQLEGVDCKSFAIASASCSVTGSWNDGKNEIAAFTDIDASLSLGVSIGGRRWGRPDDKIGFAGAINSISNDHRNYIAAGGLGILIGDGQLNYRREKILETYYALNLLKDVTLTFDYQFMANPAYNADRGPISFFSARLHGEF
jgi:Carbohydrate-selective porin, OprB family/Recombination endonuclease VII